MTDTSFLRLLPGASPLHWSAEVDDSVAVGDHARPTLFGGAGLGFAVQALERVTGRPLICATAQFLAFAYKGSRLEVAVRLAKTGFQITQAQATIRSDGEEIIAVTAALGTRPEGIERQWVGPDPLPPPDECPPIEYGWPRAEDDMHGRLDVRVGPGTAASPAEPAITRYWIRAREPIVNDSAFLAILGDFVPTALGTSLPPGRMSSLDNVLRIMAQPRPGWILCETTSLRLRCGLAHGTMRMYDGRGVLLAYASQSVIVRA